MAPIIQINEQPRFVDLARLGRRYAPDIRDSQFTMTRALRSMTRAELKRRTSAPRRGPTLDQGLTPKCVMYSAATALGAAPIQYGRTPDDVIKSVEVGLIGDAVDGVETWPDLYSWAQDHDEWPGRGYDGTSVRAGQEYLIQAGRSAAYVWAQSLDEMKDYISRVASTPIIIGIDYTEDMFNPKRVGSKWYLEPTGPVAGGHAMCALWFDKTLKAWKMQQTWGQSFADDGICYIRDEHMQTLIFGWNGEAVSFTERALKAA